MPGPHHTGSHGQPQLVMLQTAQQGPGGVPQHPQHGPQQGAHQHFYIGHPQGRSVLNKAICLEVKSGCLHKCVSLPQRCRYKLTLLRSTHLETKTSLPPWRPELFPPHLLDMKSRETQLNWQNLTEEKRQTPWQHRTLLLGLQSEQSVSHNRGHF